MSVDAYLFPDLGPWIQILFSTDLSRRPESFVLGTEDGHTNGDCPQPVVKVLPLVIPSGSANVLQR